MCCNEPDRFISSDHNEKLIDLRVKTEIAPVAGKQKVEHKVEKVVRFDNTDDKEVVVDVTMPTNESFDRIDSRENSLQ